MKSPSRQLTSVLLFVLISFINSVFAQPPKGKAVTPSAEEAAKLAGLKGKIKGLIVWSTSRDNNHDLYLMNADGTNPRSLTSGPKTDWYPRFSPDGKIVVFTRSKLDWTIEDDANKPERWDIYTVGSDGKNEKKIIADASWGTFTRDGKLLYAKGTQVYISNVDGSQEKLIADGNKEMKGGLVQHPSLSEDGGFLATTLRGKERETGILNLKTHIWFTSGGGCQFSFFPNSHKVVRVNQTGNGGTQIFAFDLQPDGTHGKISGNSIEGKDIRLIDLPGRRSHEYFPRLSPKGDYLVWGATQFGHDHDLADYEILIWKLGEPWGNATRLTFHSGNDRWPDIFLE